MYSNYSITNDVSTTSKNSMIFKTKNNELAIFGKTLDDAKNKILEFTNAYEQYGLKGKNGALSTLFGNNKQNVIDNTLINQFEKFNHSGAIILMHNISSSNEEALETVIKNMIAKGYRFASLNELE